MIGQSVGVLRPRGEGNAVSVTLSCVKLHSTWLLDGEGYGLVNKIYKIPSAMALLLCCGDRPILLRGFC